MEWNHGVEWSGVDLSGVCMMMECSAVECNGMDRWNAMQWNGMEWMHFGHFGSEFGSVFSKTLKSDFFDAPQAYQRSVPD